MTVQEKQAVQKLLELKQQVADAEQGSRLASGIPKMADGRPDYSQDFFDGPAYLTVSGQLQGECYAMGLGDIYTFGESCVSCKLSQRMPADPQSRSVVETVASSEQMAAKMMPV